MSNRLDEHLKTPSCPPPFTPMSCPTVVFLISVGGKSIFPVAWTKNLKVLWLLFLSKPLFDVLKNSITSFFKIFSRIWLPLTTPTAAFLPGSYLDCSRSLPVQPALTQQPEWTFKNTSEIMPLFCSKLHFTQSKISSLSNLSFIWRCVSQAKAKP